MRTSGEAGKATGEIEAWLRQHIAALAGIATSEVKGDDHFDMFGIDSMQSVDMLTELEGWLGTENFLPLDIIFEAPTIAEAAVRIKASMATARGDL